MTLPVDVAAALTRLLQYNSGPVGPSNPYGFADYGNVANFPAALTDFSTAATWFGEGFQASNNVWTGRQQFGQVSSTITATAGATFDCALGNTFSKTIAASVTLSVSNVPAGVAYDMRLLITYTSGFITWWSGIQWIDGVEFEPVMGKTYEVILSTLNGGTTWRAVAGEYGA